MLPLAQQDKPAPQQRINDKHYGHGRRYDTRLPPFQQYADSADVQSAQRERERITREIHDSSGYAFTNLIALMEVGTSLGAYPWSTRLPVAVYGFAYQSGHAAGLSEGTAFRTAVASDPARQGVGGFGGGTSDFCLLRVGPEARRREIATHYGRSIANDASSGRSDGHSSSFFHSSDQEEVVGTDAGSGKAHAKSKEGETTGAAHALSRVSNETGVPVDTLQAQKSATGLGYGDLEIANLLAKASGQSFDSIVAKSKAGEGWGKIAQDMGLNLGKIVSAAHQPKVKNGSNHFGDGSSENSHKPSLIPPPGMRADSIVYAGITPVPRGTVSRGVNPVPSATVGPQP